MSDSRGPDFEAAIDSAVANGAAGEINAEAEAATPEDRRPRARLLPMWILLAAVIIVGVAWAVSERYFAASDGDGSVPVITAEEMPVKVRPEEPGGVEVPDRDKYVYKSLIDEEPEAEQLLPAPEEPMDRPPAETPGAKMATDVEAATEEAPDPVRPDELDVATSEPPEAGEQDQDDMVAEGPDMAKDMAADPPPAEQPQQLLDSAQPETEMLDAAETAAPEPAPAPEPEPEPAPAPEPEAKPTPAVAPGSGFMVQVGASQNEAAAETALTRLADKHPGIMGPLSAIVVRADLGDKGIWYRMRIGPFAARSEANEVCGQLKAVDAGCFIVAN